ncbi:MAG: lysylphosphatidylglycerol synthase transmembrane domain-containing protein [Promethearchaeota archaeon]
MAVLIYILINIDLSKVISIIKSVNIYYLIIAILINPIVFFLLTERWKYICKSMGVKLKYSVYLKLRLRGVFLGNISPGKIGDFYRAKHLSEESDLEIGKSISSVIIDRILDICALILLNIVGLLLLLYFFKIGTFIVESLILSVIIVVGLIIIFKKNLVKKILRPLFRFLIPSDSKHKVVIHFNKFYDGLSYFGFSQYLITFLISVAIWLLTFTGIYILALSLSIDVPYVFILGMASVAAFVSAIPISVGGLGTREATYAFFLSSINVEPEYAVTLSLLVFIFFNLIYVPIGIVSYIFPISKKENKNV